MTKTNEFEVPENVRDFAEQSVSQAKEAYEKFADAARQAQDMVVESSDVVSTGAKEIQEKSLQYATDNMDASFKLASKLIKAKDIQQALDIQGKFAKAQMETYAEQTQKIAKLVAEASQKAQPKN